MTRTLTRHTEGLKMREVTCVIAGYYARVGEHGLAGPITFY